MKNKLSHTVIVTTLKGILKVKYNKLNSQYLWIEDKVHSIRLIMTKINTNLSLPFFYGSYCIMMYMENIITTRLKSYIFFT